MKAWALLMSALLLSAQAAPPPPTELVRSDAAMQAMAELQAGRYLAAIDRLREASRTSAWNDLASQLWLQLHPAIGGLIDPASSEPGEGKVDPATAARLAAATPADAIAAIVERARRTSVVILNEAHHSPRDRAFALEVARALRPLGYSVLAAEGFANPPDEAEAAGITARIAADGYARRDSGFYLSDPVFADFVRQSVALGFRPVSYEHNGEDDVRAPDRVALREQGQADHLVRRIFAGDPQAKVLIYVGFSHATEQPTDPSGTPWMAARLKRMTVIDPLTIDQTFLSETGDADGRAYYSLLKPKLGERPVVLLQGNEGVGAGRYAGAVDLMVVHPPLRLVQGRPDWLVRIGRRPRPVPAHLLPASGRRLVQAFVAGEGEQAIPLDQVIVEKGKPPPALMLPDGVRVRYAYQDPA